MRPLLKPKLRPKPEAVQRHNVELQAKLARADRLIAQLRAETLQLRDQIAQWQRAPAVPPAGNQTRGNRRSRTAKERGLITGKATKPTQLRAVQSNARRPLANERRLPWIRLPLQRRFEAAFVTVFGLSVAVFLSVQPLPPYSRLPVRSASQPSPVATQKPTTIAALVYNVPQPPALQRSQTLQAIVDGAVALAASKDLPTEPLSITLIDLKTNQIAGYQNQTPRYPASVVKLFWLVACAAQLEQGLLQPDSSLGADLTAMIVNSDNDAASRVFDRITQTTSGDALSGAAYDTWLQHRLQLDRFFQAASYSGISISQKNYPIDSLRLEAPDGRELQRRDEQQQPVRSMMTTDQAARLMYEIAAGRAVSASRSQAMMALLTRDLRSEWKKQPETAIAGFLGETLPADVRFASKVGMTTQVRHDVAFVTSSDGKTSYILAVFGTDPAYSQNAAILPAISTAVFTQMVERAHPSGV